ncbi:hypothetical protein [Sphingomonas sp.]|uniref:hypothetical protein n=1 Tax=Sphingomonas sp. TaxID=28214 RepID=UPI002EDAF621
MEGVLLPLAGWLDAIGLGRWASGAPYPIVNTLHLLGLVMLVGGIGVVDLRVVGFWRSLSLPALSRALTPVAIAGLAILVPTGLLLFAADGKSLAGSDMFFRKLVIIGFALTNAIAFRILWQGRLERGEPPSTTARVMAGVSLLLWLAVGTLGRLIAYS